MACRKIKYLDFGCLETRVTSSPRDPVQVELLNPTQTRNHVATGKEPGQYISYSVGIFLTDHEKLESSQDSSSRYILIVYITITILPTYGQKNLPHLEIITFQQIM